MDNKLKFFDIAANLTDGQFAGEYYVKKHHPSDVQDVIDRAAGVGCEHLLIASGCLQDLGDALAMCEQSDKFFTTGGIHPCRAGEPDKSPDGGVYWSNLVRLIEEGVSRKKLLVDTHPIQFIQQAIGECGLDYDRLEWSTKEQQLRWFEPHFDLAAKYGLPMYLHNRNTGTDFYEIMERNRHRISGGIVHSFTGSQDELMRILKLDLYVGVNGCSLKSEDNLSVLRQIPLDRLMIETDSPYCEIRNSHASSKWVKSVFDSVRHEKFKKGSLVKNRNEPCRIVQVLEAVAGVIGMEESKLAQVCFENTMKFFKLIN